ncbi:myo-inositol transporter [Purpureocillium lavendulum]|uniref:Myo-inositol transporter n=1 Tax=Purpureocillium lavendulum TaxID=1247861 RepID=A0AB34FW34_9HYPO|nr:myo-inositol transporter [Purpureocillium lavendulum]
MASSELSLSSDNVKERPTPFRRFFSRRSAPDTRPEKRPSHPRWSFGVLNDRETVEVPGSVLLLAANRNEPLGLRNVRARTSHSSIPAGFPVDHPSTPRRSSMGHRTTEQAPPQDGDPAEGKKKTDDGTIILEPQPEDSANDPLNWPGWRRDTALVSLGFYCMIGGGIGPLIAAGFTDIAREYHVTVENVSLVVGLYMMGLGVGSVLASPTAILYGKRPVYLASAIVFIATCAWAGHSPSFPSLLAARVFQGMAMSPVECLPSATIAEIFFLHERAYRIGIYTLLLLGGKNLIPLVSAAIIERFGWRWVFFIVAMVAGLGLALLFLFVPETFWDRTPTRRPSKRPSFLRRVSSRRSVPRPVAVPDASGEAKTPGPLEVSRGGQLHVEFATQSSDANSPKSVTKVASTRDLREPLQVQENSADHRIYVKDGSNAVVGGGVPASDRPRTSGARTSEETTQRTDDSGKAAAGTTPVRRPPATDNGPLQHHDINTTGSGVSSPRPILARTPNSYLVQSPYTHSITGSDANTEYFMRGPNLDNEQIPASALRAPPKVKAYTHVLRQQPAQTFAQHLRPYHGRLNNDRWIKVMVRPFVLFSYPAVLWSAAVYSCSVGWLMVISETMAIIYRDPASYNFDSLQTGLVYVSPFIGGILGTGVAGKISDMVVRAMSRRNGGLYEPEFRLVMAIPVALATCIGLMGFGWSAQDKDHWMVPTAFLGVLSFGCSLGSTTAITFCVDSFRQYAGEALVTLNFAKNILHGLVFSLFVSHWMARDGPRKVFIWLGIIQLVLQLTTIPLFIYGKRARMWTVRKNFMEKF